MIDVLNRKYHPLDPLPTDVTKVKEKLDSIHGVPPLLEQHLVDINYVSQPGLPNLILDRNRDSSFMSYLRQLIL